MMKAGRSKKRAILASLKSGEGGPDVPFILSKIVPPKEGQEVTQHAC